MEITFINELYVRLMIDLTEVADVAEGSLSRLQGALALIGKAGKEVDEHLKVYPFNNMEEEVVFKKVLEPKFSAHKYYEQWLFALHQYQPVTMCKEEYYRLALAQCQRLKDQHPFHFHYFNMGLTQLDHIFFVSEGTNDAVLPPMDNLYAQFIANKRFENYLLELLDPSQTEDVQHLNWTGETINLIEVIFGLAFTGQISHGNASPAQIARMFEKVFHVSLGKVHRRFTEITRRKRLSSTAYLDQMVVMIKDKVELMNE